MGYTNAMDWSSGVRGFSDAQNTFIAMDDIGCRENHGSFWDCSYNRENNDCGHDEDVFLTCGVDDYDEGRSFMSLVLLQFSLVVQYDSDS